MSTPTIRPEVGTKVRCVRKQCSFENNLLYLEIGEVYTIGEFLGFAHPGELVLVETNLNGRRPIFSLHDFELVTNSYEDAYDRAMGIL